MLLQMGRVLLGGAKAGCRDQELDLLHSAAECLRVASELCVELQSPGNAGEIVAELQRSVQSCWDEVAHRSTAARRDPTVLQQSAAGVTKHSSSPSSVLGLVPSESQPTDS